MESRQRVKRDERVAFWRAHVETWRTSGVSQSRYSREHGIRQKWSQLLDSPLQDTRNALAAVRHR